MVGNYKKNNLRNRKLVVWQLQLEGNATTIVLFLFLFDINLPSLPPIF